MHLILEDAHYSSPSSYQNMENFVNAVMINKEMDLKRYHGEALI